MMTKTQDHVTTRARTKIQASGELNVEERSSLNVFLGVWMDDGGGAAPPPPLPSMTMVVVVVDDDRAEEGDVRNRGQTQGIKR